eukprot:15338586-Ditylum_brightwellii.AAC.1
MLESAPNNPILGRGSFDNLPPMTSSKEEQHRLRYNQHTPSTASLSSPASCVDFENASHASNDSSVEIDKYAMADPHDTSVTLFQKSASNDLEDHNVSSLSPMKPRSLAPSFDNEQKIEILDQSTEGENNLNISADENSACAKDQTQSVDSSCSTPPHGNKKLPADDISCAATERADNSNIDTSFSYDMEHDKIRHHT